jgi:hypothetical protein
MQLIDLVGEHVLTGVEFDTLPRNSCGDAPNVVRFALDGKTYEASEDPSDGYRSMLAEIRVAERAVATQFEPCQVVARYLDGDREVLELVDASTGKTVLAVGTENTDDYYPYYVANFTPEAMAVNAERRPATRYASVWFMQQLTHGYRILAEVDVPPASCMTDALGELDRFLEATIERVDFLCLHSREGMRPVLLLGVDIGTQVAIDSCAWKLDLRPPR